MVASPVDTNYPHSAHVRSIAYVLGAKTLRSAVHVDNRFYRLFFGRECLEAAKIFSGAANDIAGATADQLDLSIYA